MAEAMRKALKCPQCGAPLSAGDKVCGYCGSEFVMQTPSSQDSQRESTVSFTMPSGNIQISQNTTQFVSTDDLQHVSSKNKYVAAFLAFFLGFFGIHHFYLRRNALGVLSIIFCWTGIPAIIGIFEALYYLLMSEKSFNAKY
jgi:TM2 domain-containing membrane protein YozV